jgi:hypothetical protein
VPEARPRSSPGREAGVGRRAEPSSLLFSQAPAGRLNAVQTPLPGLKTKKKDQRRRAFAFHKLAHRSPAQSPLAGLRNYPLLGAVPFSPGQPARHTQGTQAPPFLPPAASNLRAAREGAIGRPGLSRRRPRRHWPLPPSIVPFRRDKYPVPRLRGMKQLLPMLEGYTLASEEKCG